MKKRMSVKIISAIVLCSVVVSSIVGITSIIKSTSIIKIEANDKLLNMASSRGNECNIEISKAENTVRELSEIVKKTVDVSKAKDDNYLKSYENQLASTVKALGDSNSGVVGVYVNFDPSFTSGKKGFDVSYRRKESAITIDGNKLEDYKEENKDFDWYYDALNAKKGVWSNLYVDKNTNINMISYTMPVYYNNQLVGVAGVDISFERLKDLILSTKVYDTGYAFLLSANYDFLVDKAKTSKDNLSTMESGKYKYITDEMKNNKSSIMEINYEGKETVIAYYKMDNGQILGINVPKAEVFENLSKVMYIIGLVIFIGIVVSILIAVLISKKMSKPIQVSTNFIEKMSRLDLTPSEENIDIMVSSKDEIGVMGKSLVSLREELINIVESLKQESDIIFKNSSDINSNSSDALSYVENVAASTEQLAAGLQETSASAQEMNANAENIEQAVKTIAEKSRNGAEEVIKINKRATDTKNQVIKSQEKTGKILLTTKEELEEAIESSKVVEQISVLSQAIMQIAKQTNLIALNAAIEASRAGEAGRGFSVVAEEIRKLAEQSQSTVSQIQNIIVKVVESVNELSNSSSKLLEFVNNDVYNDYKNMIDVMDKYNEDAKFVENLVKDFSSTSESLLFTTNEVLKNIEIVTQSANEGAEGTTDIAQKVTNITSKSSNILDLAEKSKDSCEKLKEQMSKFII